MDENEFFKRIKYKSGTKKKSAVLFFRKKEKKNIDFEWELPKIDEIIFILKKQKKERTHKDIKLLNDYLTTNLQYFKELKNKSDPFQYEKTLYVLKYEEVRQGKNIVTFGEDGDKCYIVLEGAIAIFKPIYVTKKLTLREYIFYLKELDRKDPTKLARERIMEKNNHIEADVLSLLNDNPLKINNEDKLNIFTEYFEKIFEAKEGFSFGESALLHKQKRNATVRAEKFCKLIYIDKYDYNRVLKEIEKKKIDESIKKFVKKFNFFTTWGYANLNKLFSYMTDLQLFKNEFLYKQNEDSEYIYFCIEGTYEIYSLISFGWKKEFIKYISNSDSNFFLKIDPTKRMGELRLLRIVNKIKDIVPKSPMMSSEFDFGKFNIGLIEQNNIEELIITKDKKFSNPYDIFKITMNNLDSSGILGLIEAIEFKKRFTSIKVKSKEASLKRIKVIDFLKVLVSNQKDERNDELMLNYICEKKKSLLTQILLSFNYQKSLQMNKYIEEYKKCYSGCIYNKPINKAMINYINTLSTNPTDKNKTKNIFCKRKSKLTNPINLNLNLNLNLNINSNLFKSSKSISSGLLNSKRNSRRNTIRNSKKNNSIRIRPFSTNTNININNEKIYKRNSIQKYTLSENSQISKCSSFSPNFKNIKNTKIKEEIKNFVSNNETTLSSSNFSNLHKNLSNKTLINYKKNILILSKNKNGNSRNIKKMGLGKNFFDENKKDKLPLFNVKDFKKNLYFKCGFFVNEIIKLGLGPNIPLRKEIMFLNNDDNYDKNMLSIESAYSNSKAFSLEIDERKRRNNFLKLTKL